MRPVHAFVWMVSGCGRIAFDVTSLDAAASDAVLDASLIAWHQFEDAPGDGAVNSVPGGAPGTCVTTCPTVTTGIRGDAYQFDGASDAIFIPDSPALRITNGTVAFWVRHDELPAPGMFSALVGKPFGTSYSNSWETSLGYNSTPMLRGGGDAVALAHAEAPWTDGIGTWIHVALTWGTTARVYTQGAMRAEKTGFAVAYDDHPVLIGVDFDASIYSWFLAGAVDDVRIYSRELAPDEIAALATP